LGTGSRHGGLDWPLEEIRNSAAANIRGISSPMLRGYIVRRGRMGIVEELYLLFDFLEDHICCDQFLSHSNDKAEALKALGIRFFDLIFYMHQQGVAHLDLHLKNVMLPADGDMRAAKVIDFETCHVAPFSAPHAYVYFPEILAFQLGYLFRSMQIQEQGILEFFDEVWYDVRVEVELVRHGIPRERFNRVYQMVKRGVHCGKRDLLLMATNGTLPW
jgi:serine/threonine protein kinase